METSFFFSFVSLLLSSGIVLAASTSNPITHAVSMPSSRPIHKCHVRIRHLRTQEMRDRGEIVRKWLCAAEHIVKSSNQKAVKKLFDWVLRNYVVGKMTHIQTHWAWKPKTREFFLVAPITPQDQRRYKSFGKYQKHTCGSYEYAYRVLVISSLIPLSKSIAGFLFLHESFHARRHIKGYFNMRELFYSYTEEVHVLNFQNKMLMAYGRKKYRDLIYSVIQEIDAYTSPYFVRKLLPTAKNFAMLAQNYAWLNKERSRFDKKLAEIFGKALSFRDKLMRRGMLLRHASFLFIETRADQGRWFFAKKLFLLCRARKVRPKFDYKTPPKR